MEFEAPGGRNYNPEPEKQRVSPLLLDRARASGTGTLTLLALFLALASTSATPFGEVTAYVRLNGVGYSAGEQKTAFLMSPTPEDGAVFQLIRQDTGRIVYEDGLGRQLQGWSRSFPCVYLLDFSSVQTPGDYTLRVEGPRATDSFPFRISTARSIYTPLLKNALVFYGVQRDGQNVDPHLLGRKPAHLLDAAASVFETPRFHDDVPLLPLRRMGGPVDLEGGWADAGDYMKFVATASYTDGAMLFALLRYPAAFKGKTAGFYDEARRGLDWLLKCWDPEHRILYYQVGLGDGDGKTLGDHDLWRLPQDDDTSPETATTAAKLLRSRPVFRAGPPGTPVSPNVGGRLAAVFAMGYRLFRNSDPVYSRRCLQAAASVFSACKTQNVGELLTTSPHSFYPEVEWRDDMEWGAVELYRAVADLQGERPRGVHPAVFYLKASAHWASAYMASPHNGEDSLNLYDVSGLAHAELYEALCAAGASGLGKVLDMDVSPDDLIGDLRDQLDRGLLNRHQNPFGLAVPENSSDVAPHALGYAVEATLFDEITRSRRYESLARIQRDWVLGANAWGSSFIVGAGPVYPRDLHHQVANLCERHSGRLSELLGATVDGPATLDQFSDLSPADNMRLSGDLDTYRVFTGRDVRFLDSTVSWATVEPADDYTALTVVLFAQQIASPALTPPIPTPHPWTRIPLTRIHA